MDRKISSNDIISMLAAVCHEDFSNFEVLIEDENDKTSGYLGEMVRTIIDMHSKLS